MQIGPFGLPELLAILAIALVVFGPRKLPELSRSLGRAIGEFRRGTMDLRRGLEQEVRDLDREVRQEQPAGTPGMRSVPEESVPSGMAGGGPDPVEADTAPGERPTGGGGDREVGS